MVESGHGHKVSKLLRRREVTQCDAFVHLMVESDIVKSLFEVPADQFIIDESFPRQEIEILLEALTNKVALKASEELSLALLQLALKQGEHAPRYSSEWVVLVIFKVLVRCECHDGLDHIQVLLVLKALLGITRNVDATETVKLLQKFLFTHSVIDRNNTSTASLEEISM